MRVADRYRRGAPGAGAPKVSVAITTFRHEAFIADAIEGVLMQDTDFPVEIVVGEDCSPDGTREVILDYAARYPGLIRLSDYERNIGAARNFIVTLSRCRGTYTAMLDGDDYWTAPRKLAAQAALLDRRPDVAMCFHPVARLRDGRVVKSAVQPLGRRRRYRLADLAHWLNISTSSMLFRRSALPFIPPWYEQVKMGDWALQTLLAERGDIVCLPEVMGVYRIHGGNIWADKGRPRSDVLSEQIEEVEAFIRHLGDARAGPFERSQHRRWYEMVHALADEGRAEQARDILRTRANPRGWDARVDLLEPFLCRLHLAAPRAFRGLRFDAVLLNRLLHRAWGRLVRPLLDLAAARSR